MMKANPLEGVQFVAPGVAQMVYLIQLVPTAYVFTTRNAMLTNQYSVTEHVRLGKCFYSILLLYVLLTVCLPIAYHQ